MSKELEKLTGGKGLPVFIEAADGDAEDPVSITGADLILVSAGTVFSVLTQKGSGAEESVLTQMKLNGDREVLMQLPIPCNGERYFENVAITAGQIAVYFPVK